MSVRRICVLVVGLLVAGVGVLHAQTGPGGVGTTDGNSDLRIWLRADEGVSPATDESVVTGWTNQAGTSNPSGIAGDPTFQNGSSDLVGGEPVIRFDGTDDQFDFNSTDFGVPDGDNTLIVVSVNSGGSLGQYILGFGADNTARRALEYELDGGRAQLQFSIGATSGDPSGNGQPGADKGNKAVSSSYNTGNVSIFSSTVNGATQDLLANGDFLDGGDAATVSPGTAVVGQSVTGDIAEVIAFRDKLNAAELTIVHNYLATKYGLSLGPTIADVYEWDSAYPGDVAGVAGGTNAIEQSPQGNKKTAQSSGLYLDKASQFTGNGEYLLYGHDEANLAFTNVEPPNGRSSNIQKLAREWRVDMTKKTSVNGITMGFDESVLDQSNLNNSNKLGVSNSYNDYFLYVDSDGDFSSGATKYDLESQGSGLYTTPNDVQIDDGDYVTVARIQRTITFSKSEDGGFEDAGVNSGNNDNNPVSVTASLNFEDSKSLSVPYTVSGITRTIDGVSTNSPVQGSNNDYTVGSGSFSFGSNTTSDTQTPFTVVEDGDGPATGDPSTEFVRVGLGSLPSRVSAGSVAQFDYGIIDDDNAKSIAFGSGLPVDTSEGDTGNTRLTYTVTLPDGETGKSTVLYTVTGTATAGEDYEIVSASDPSATTGEATIPAGNQTGTFAIDVLGDALKEPDETFTLTLIGATSATIEDSGNRSTTFTITDDEDPPKASFASTSFSGTEGQTADVTVELTSAAGQDYDVAIRDDGTGTADPGNSKDYEFPGDPTVTIPAGETQATISIPLNLEDDQTGGVEETETIEISIDENNTGPTTQSPTSATVSILDASGLGAKGPGGVGSASSVRTWLRADEGVTTSSGNVSTWADQSGNSNDATDDGSAPSYNSQDTNFNGLPVVNFGGSQYLNTTNLTGLPSDVHTLFVVSNAGGAGAVLGIDDGSFNSVRTLEYTSGSNADASQDGTSAGGVGAGGTSVLTSEFDGSNVTIAANGGTDGSPAGANSNSNGTYAFLGAEVQNTAQGQGTDPGAENSFTGDVAEFIAYNRILNQAQRRIVENYLASKYAVGTITNDLYDGDVGADGTQGGGDDRDTDVLGVGQASNGDKHFTASAGGLTISVAGGADNGEYVFAGRKVGVEQRINVTDTSTVNDIGVTARLNDDRYIDVTDDGQTTDGLRVDLTFDFDEFGVRGPAGDVSDYVLLRRGGTSGDWTKVSAGGGVSSSGSTVTFANVSLTNADDGYFTIGTTSSSDSPLDTRFTAVTGESGTSGDNAQNGPDAGYLDLGLPITEGTVADIVRPDGTQLFTSTVLGRPGLNSNTGIVYKWNYGTQSYDDVSNLSGTSTNLPNGQGFTVWIKDSPELPVDPELNFGLNDVSSVPTSNQTETVPDQSGTYVFLANPYLAPYDMTAFTDLEANGFQATIASWDPDNGGTYGSYVTKTQGTSGDNVSRYQGFFLERTATGSGTTSFTFDSAGRLTDQNVPLVGAKSRTKSTSLTYRRLKLKLSVFDGSGNEVARDVGANVLFTDRAGGEWDAYDAPKYRPPSNRYATIAPLGTGKNGSQVAKSQESRVLSPSEPLEIPLELRTKNLSGSFELSARAFESIPDSWEVTLVDTKGTADPADDTSHDLVPEGAPYRFQVGTKTAKTKGPPAPGATTNPLRRPLTMKASGSTPRFKLKIDPQAAPLPVELASFKARTDGQAARLTWTTASETNNAGFQVERKTDTGFKTIGFVDGAGTTQEPQNYQYRVEDLEYGTHTFRLRQVDQSGTSQLSKTTTASIQLDKAYDVGDPYPNPFRRRSTLEVAVREAQDVTVEVYNVLGQRVHVLHQGRIEANETRRFQLDGRRLSTGPYFLRVRGEGFMVNRRAMLVK